MNLAALLVMWAAFAVGAGVFGFVRELTAHWGRK